MQVIAGIAFTCLVLFVIRAILTRGEGTLAVGAGGAAAAPPTEDSIRECMLSGRKIDAIKAYRRLHGVDLKTAKEAVERLAGQLPPTP